MPGRPGGDPARGHRPPGHPRVPERLRPGRPGGHAHAQADGQGRLPGTGRSLGPHGAGGALQLFQLLGPGGEFSAPALVRGQAPVRGVAPGRGRGAPLRGRGSAPGPGRGRARPGALALPPGPGRGRRGRAPSAPGLVQAAQRIQRLVRGQQLRGVHPPGGLRAGGAPRLGAHRPGAAGAAHPGPGQLPRSRAGAALRLLPGQRRASPAQGLHPGPARAHGGGPGL